MYAQYAYLRKSRDVRIDPDFDFTKSKTLGLRLSQFSEFSFESCLFELFFHRLISMSFDTDQNGRSDNIRYATIF